MTDFAVDIGLNHQDQQRPRYARCNRCCCRTDADRQRCRKPGLQSSNHASGKRDNQDLVTGQLSVFNRGNAGQLQQLLQNGV